MQSTYNLVGFRSQEITKISGNTYFELREYIAGL